MPIDVRPDDLYTCPRCLELGTHPKRQIERTGPDGRSVFEELDEIQPYYRVCPTHGRPDPNAALVVHDHAPAQRSGGQDDPEAEMLRRALGQGPLLYAIVQVLRSEVVFNPQDFLNWMREAEQARQRPRPLDRVDRVRPQPTVYDARQLLEPADRPSEADLPFAGDGELGAPVDEDEDDLAAPARPAPRPVAPRPPPDQERRAQPARPTTRAGRAAQRKAA